MDETVRRLILWHQSEIARLSALLSDNDGDDGEDVLVFATPNHDDGVLQASPTESVDVASQSMASQDMFVTQRNPVVSNAFADFLDGLGSDEE